MGKSLALASRSSDITKGKEMTFFEVAVLIGICLLVIIGVTLISIGENIYNILVEKSVKEE